MPIGNLKPSACFVTLRVGLEASAGDKSRCKFTLRAASIVSAALMATVVTAMMLSHESASAAPYEIRVITDDLTDRGDVSLELHAASVHARTGSTTQYLEQGLAELSYGISNTLGVSVQLPVLREPGWRANGVNFELQYIAHHDHHKGPYWGARVELERVRSPPEIRMTPALELRPVIGYRLKSWHTALNMAMRAPLAGPDRKTSFELSAKLARGIATNMQLGVEYYSQAQQPSDGAEKGLARRRLALLVIDTKVQGVVLSSGVGRGGLGG